MEIKHQNRIKNHLFREASENHAQINAQFSSLIGNGNPNGNHKIAFADLQATEWLHEKPGSLIKTVQIETFDEGSEKDLKKAIQFNGFPTELNAIVTQSQPKRGELNLATVEGIFLGIDYTLGRTSAPIIQNSTCSWLVKHIRMEPFTKDVLVKVRTGATLPQDRLRVAQTRLSWVQKAGVQANLITSLSYYNIADMVGHASKNDIIISLYNQLGAPEVVEYRSEAKQEFWLRVPAGNAELVYTCYLIGNAFTSSDVLTYNHQQVAQAEVAMLDLRSPGVNLDDKIIDNLLSGYGQYPPGGVKIKANLEFYDIVTLDPEHV